jgi:dCMP deaminase
MPRRDKINYYLDIAEAVALRGTCLRRNFGAIIVHHDQIVSTGYVGAPRGRKNCSDLGYCTREKFNIPRGERYELCRSVHAEANAIIHAARSDMLGASLYLVGKEYSDGSYVQNAAPCAMCKRLIINAASPPWSSGRRG